VAETAAVAAAEPTSTRCTRYGNQGSSAVAPQLPQRHDRDEPRRLRLPGRVHDLEQVAFTGLSPEAEHGILLRCSH
jgi:hypothetical protein